MINETTEHNITLPK